MPKLILLSLLCCCLIPSAALAAASPLEVITRQPEGQVEHLTQIVVRFSEPMRPLGAMEQEAASSPLQLGVPGGVLPPGTYRWLDPATLAYLFDTPVQAPLRIEARIPAGTAALSGARLPEEVRWSLRTPPLAVSASADELPPQGGVIYITASYELDQQSLREALRLSVDGKALDFTLETPDASGIYQGRRDEWHYFVHLKTPLQAEKKVTMQLKAGLTAKGGYEPEKAREWTFPTFRLLRLKGWQAGYDRKKDAMTPEEPVWVTFNQPVAYKELLPLLEISPPVKRTVTDEELESMRDAVSDQYTLPFAWEARTRYTVTLRPGLKGQYGGGLDAAHTFTFTTGDFEPFFFMETGSKVMERSQGGLFPISLRNTGPVTLTLRYAPWESILGDMGSTTRAESFTDLPKGRETTVTLDYTGQPNTNIQHMLDIPETLGLPGPGAVNGLVEIEAAIPQKGSSQPRINRVRLQVTGLGVLLKAGQDSGLAWVSDMETGTPVAGAKLRVLDGKGAVIWQGASDEQGLARLPGGSDSGDERYVLEARTDDDIAVISPKMYPLPETYHTRPAQSGRSGADMPWAAHLVSQLPLYQPGQTVRYTLYLAEFGHHDDADNAVPDWKAVAGDRFTLSILDSRNKVVHTQQATSNGFGSFSGECTLAEAANLGSYTIRVAREGFKQDVRGEGFQVAAFRPPDFKVDVTAPASRPDLLADEPPLTAGISAAYFSGASLPGAEVLLQVRESPSWYRPSLLSGYAVGVGGNQPWRSYIPSRSEYGAEEELRGTLDASGKAVFDLPAFPRDEDKPAPRDISLEATVTDASGLTTQGTDSYTLHPSSVYLGLRAPRFAPVGRVATLDLKAASWDDKPMAAVRARLWAERQATRTQEKELAWEREELLANPQGQTVDVRFEKSGTYVISLSTTDEQDRKALTTTTVYVPGPDMEWSSSRPSGQLELMTDKETYTMGETAEIVIRNPYKEALALITRERGGVREYEMRPVSGPAPSVSIPLGKSEAPYVFVSVALIRGRIKAPFDVPGDEGHDLGSPRVSHGTIRLDVNDVEEARLDVTIRTDGQEYRPGGTVKTTVRVTDERGKGRKAQVTLLAVDDRILRAAGEQLRYDPAQSFSRIFVYGVLGADVRAALLNMAMPLMNARMRIRAQGSYDYRAYKGGLPIPMPAMAAQESADASGAQNGETLRENFDPMAFWLGEGETDENGTLATSFTLPDTLTSYRIVAVATDARRFAAGESSLRVSKPLQLLSAMPRFAVEGDRLEARVLVQNLGEEEKTIQIEALAHGMTLDRNTYRMVLKPGGSGVAAFPARATQSDEAWLDVRAAMDDERDSARFSLPVLPPRPLKTVAAAGLLRQGESHVMPVELAHAPDPRSSLTVTAAASPAAGLNLVGQELLEYPWHCLEQRLSRAWLRALRLSHGSLINLPPADDDREVIGKTLQSVASFQREDGGFGLWPGLNFSSPYLTAYVLLVNSQLSELDMAIAEDVKDRALAYLQDYLKQAYASDKKHTSIETDAMALWMLVRARGTDTVDLFTPILNRAEETQAPPLAWAALLLANKELTDLSDGKRSSRRKRILTGLEKLAAVTPVHLHFASAKSYGYWMTMGSTLRDNGLLLAALAAEAPEYPRLEALAAWLGQGLNDKESLSTQEAIFGLHGLVRYLDGLGGDRTSTIRIDWNNEQSVHRFTRLVDPPQDWRIGLGSDPVAGELKFTADEGQAYWTARLRYDFPSQPGQPDNAGFTLSRAWAGAPRDPETGIPSWAMGALVDVTVTVVVPSTRRHVLLFDPFPAGLEPLHATRVDVADAAASYQYPWQFQEIRTDGMLLYAEQVEPGEYTYTYTLRAAAPGVFIQRPSRVEEMYTPEVFGSTTGDLVEVTP